MTTVQIHDLPQSRELDCQAMSAVRGGLMSLPGPSGLPGLAGVANVNVGVNLNQQIIQMQAINVNALNNIGVIGANLGFKLKLDPSQYARTGF